MQESNYIRSSTKAITLGRYKKIEIEGLFFENFAGMFDSTVAEVFQQRKLTSKQISKVLAEQLDGLIKNYEELISDSYLKFNKFKLETFLEGRFSNQRKIAEANKESFTAFILYIDASASIYQQIINKIQRKRIDSTLTMNVALYGLILRRAEEIIDLLLNGYIDGAMIIWRSMYENVIILLVLAIENDNKLTDKFFHHAIRGSRRKVASYQNNYQALKFPALSPSAEVRLNTSTDKIQEKYGKKFLQDDYGWASGLFDDKVKVNFKMLEDRVQMSKYRVYYLACSEQTHSNFNGFINFSVSNKIVLPKLLAQEINLRAFIDPMQFTISILEEVNDYILYEFSTPGELKVNSLFLGKIYEKLQKSYSIKSRKSKK